MRRPAPNPRRTIPIVAAACAIVLRAAPALADDTASSPPPAQNSGPLGFLAGIDRSQYMLGDMWGLRPLLNQYGMTFNLSEVSEVLGNVTGGTRTGADYDGLTTMTLQMDTQRAFGWYGGTFNVSALQIHGRNLSADNLRTLQTASGIEADRSTRLWELWYQQKFLDEDRARHQDRPAESRPGVHGQPERRLFVNTMFGWPMLPSADLPGGGPAYPLSALGVRLRGAADRRAHVPARRVQRQPGRAQHRRPAGRKCVRHQLSAQRRRAGDRRAAIRLSRH